MYVKLSQEKKETVCQGDIIEDFPFFNLINLDDNNINVLDKNQDGTYRVDALPIPFPASKEREIFGIIPGKTKRVIVLSQTCDIENNDYVQIAPILSLDEVKLRIKTDKIGLIKSHRSRVNDWFYLPSSKDENFNKTSSEDFPDEGFVFLQTINSFPKEKFMRFSNKRMVSLSEWGQSLLSWALVNYFGRPIENIYRKKSETDGALISKAPSDVSIDTPKQPDV